MGNFKDKSELSLDAAEFLHKGNYYNSVAHCAYYSCFQLMMNIWLRTTKKTEEDLKNLSKELQQGSHDTLINEIKTFIRNKSNDSREFNKTILDLKRLRVDSDYKQNYINCEQSEKSISLSRQTQQI